LLIDEFEGDALLQQKNGDFPDKGTGITADEFHCLLLCANKKVSMAQAKKKRQVALTRLCED
jgi:hypothetical protein